ncbi:Golgi apparatus membrane protein TVP23 homolog A-like [Branchiostoma lanceolatum]|uniref:Golgi apparatus membrane protein TVP23 homolog A-like n=1 Tax=Branchiostoma lanceolatum TaxID=7740 RepID=UPI0034559862
MEDGEDVALDFGSEDDAMRHKRVRHPVACFFHLFFRVLAIITYLFCGLFSNSFVTSFVIIVMMLSLDFWTVKNITGRLLVGLRWWNHVDEDGKSHWIFEARKKPGTLPPTAAESRVFWLGLIICPIIWSLFFFGTLFALKLNWLAVVVVGLSLSAANLYGYIRCKVGGKKKLSSIATNFLGQQILQRATATTPTDA